MVCPLYRCLQSRLNEFNSAAAAESEINLAAVTVDLMTCADVSMGWQSLALTRLKILSIKFALHQPLHVVQLFCRITGLVALNMRTRYIIRSAKESVTVLVDHFKIEISGGR